MNNANKTILQQTPNYDIVAEYFTKRACAQAARQAGNFNRAIAHEQWAGVIWHNMTEAQRAEVA